MGIQRSVDALAMVMLGGIQTLTGPAWGAALFTWLQDSAARNIDYWRALIGIVILGLVIALPQGLGTLAQGGRK
jgi:branched-chain amino acid transport system permease protein